LLNFGLLIKANAFSLTHSLSFNGLGVLWAIVNLALLKSMGQRGVEKRRL
jgi:hypothetical protein